MHGSSPAKAVNGYLDTLGRALACISHAPVLASAYHAGTDPIGVNLNQGDPAPLRGGFLPLDLRFEQQFAPIEDRGAPACRRWSLVLATYWYTVSERDSHRELFAFHWHPGAGRIDFPHLHVGSRILSEPALTGRHIPTGLVTVPDLIQFLVAELSVQPQRSDWRRVLAATREALASA